MYMDQRCYDPKSETLASNSTYPLIGELEYGFAENGPVGVYNPEGKMPSIPPPPCVQYVLDPNGYVERNTPREKRDKYKHCFGACVAERRFPNMGIGAAA